MKQVLVALCCLLAGCASKSNHQTVRISYVKDGSMPTGGLAASKRALDLAIDKVHDSNIDLGSTWTNEFLPETK